jgi:hypothetical protein
MTELTRKCLSLNRADRARLAKILTESVERPEPQDGERFQVLYEAATRMFGQGILTGSRDYLLTLGRKFIVYQMVNEGYSRVTVGKYLRRHHASIIHMYKMMQDVFEHPYAFKVEMAYWEQFQKEIKK